MSTQIENISNIKTLTKKGKATKKKEYFNELINDPNEAGGFYEAIKMAQRICIEHDPTMVAKHNSRLEDLREYFKILETSLSS